MADRKGPERCRKPLGEGVAMTTKVVKSFKEKVINIVKCGSNSNQVRQEFPLWT